MNAARPVSDRDSRGKDLDGGRLLHKCRVKIELPDGDAVEFESDAPSVAEAD